MDGDKNRKRKIAIIWYFGKAEWVYPNWRDGHRAAFEEIAKKHEVTWHIGKKKPDPSINWDFLLFWDDSNSEMFNFLDEYKCRKGICLTTDPHNMDNLRKLDVVFVESDPIFNTVKSAGIRCIKAFGTDTDFYTPYNGPELKKDIKYFYPATFSPWKRQSEIAHLGSDLVCIGTIQPDGVGEYEACKKAGVTIMADYFPAEVIRDYYRRARKVIIPAVHGSERTVLEAMSCNVWPEVLHPNINIRTASYVEEYVDWREEKMKAGGDGRKLQPRQFVLERYSHVKFAESLLKGIENV